MDFMLTEEQAALQQAAREFAVRELAPLAAEHDRSEAFPWDSLQALWSAGYLGMTIPEAYGGGGLDLLAHTLVLEQMAMADASVSVLMEVHNTLHAAAVVRWGQASLQAAYLPRLATDLLGAFAITEPQAGSDAASIRTRAERTAAGWRISGEKAFITGAGSAGAYLVFAVTDPSKGSRGITCFEVPKEAAGLSFGPPLAKMGIRAAHTASLVLDGVEVGDEQRVGEPGEGYRIALTVLDYGRVGIAAQALGLAESALARTVDYAGEREQFGRKIGQFQGVGFKLADMATQIEAVRWLVYRAAWLAGQPGRHTPEIAKAKLLASRVAVNVTLEAIQVHGGYGYMRDFGVERLARDAKITEIYEGTSEIQRMVIAQSLLKSPHAPGV